MREEKQNGKTSIPLTIVHASVERSLFCFAVGQITLNLTLTINASHRSAPRWARSPFLSSVKGTLNALLLVVIATGLVTACSGGNGDAQTSVRLDETGLVAAIGRPPAYEYSLDDGRGLNFRGKGEGPDFTLEIRTGRVNVAWAQYLSEPGKFDAMNAQNRVWAEQVLTYSLGSGAVKRVLESVGKREPLTFTHQGYRVSVSPGSGQTLVAIKQ